MNRMLLEPLLAHPLDALPQLAPHGVLATLGYERRARAISEALGRVSGPKAAVGFTEQHHESYDENEAFFEAQGFGVHELGGNDFRRWVHAWLIDATASQGSQPVVVDISSMTRTRIGAVVEAVTVIGRERELVVDFVYTAAKFERPGPLPSAILHLSPVSEFFVGSVDPAGQVVALIGLGYEPQKASGTIEELEPRTVVAFLPRGTDKRYYEALLEANSDLLEGPHAPDRDEYEVEDPYACLGRLERRVAASLQKRLRPALVPLGPKIFALCAFLVSALYPGQIPVWRVTFGASEKASERESDGRYCGIRVKTRAVTTREELLG